jgi:hypothetical protein
MSLFHRFSHSISDEQLHVPGLVDLVAVVIPDQRTAGWAQCLLSLGSAWHDYWMGCAGPAHWAFVEAQARHGLHYTGRVQRSYEKHLLLFKKNSNTSNVMFFSVF